MAGVWMEDVQVTCWSEEIMLGEEDAVKSEAIAVFPVGKANKYH